MYDTHADALCPEHLFESFIPIPFGTLAAAVEIKGRGLKFGIGMTCEMRFRQERETRDAAGWRKLMPHLLAQDLQVKLCDDAVKESAQGCAIAQSRGPASGRIYEPFCANDHKRE